MQRHVQHQQGQDTNRDQGSPCRGESLGQRHEPPSGQHPKRNVSQEHKPLWSAYQVEQRQLTRQREKRRDLRAAHGFPTVDLQEWADCQ